MIRQFAARITTVPISEGGNASSIVSGYRALLHYNGQPLEDLHGVEILPESGDLQAGATATVVVTLLYPEQHRNWACVGNAFQLFDGPNMRAFGVIESVENDSLSATS